MITTFTKRTILIPEDVMSMFDLEFLGVEKDFPEQLSFIPYRKKRNLKLSHKKKYRIRSEKHAKKRIVIESIPSAN